jgi:hypothetical protein
MIRDPKSSVSDTILDMDSAEAKQKASDALFAKLRDALELELVEGLPVPPYDFNPDGWMLSRIEPFATLIGATVDLWNARKMVSRNEYEMAGKALAQAFSNQVTDKTFVAGIASVLDFLQPDQMGGRKAAQAIGDVVGGFIPNLGAQTDRELDGHVRDARKLC